MELIDDILYIILYFLLIFVQYLIVRFKVFDKFIVLRINVINEQCIPYAFGSVILIEFRIEILC